MSTLLAITLAAAAAVEPNCSWDNPGANPYTGNTDVAIDHYTDIPESARAKLKRRVKYGNPDETVSITRDAIKGRHHYDTNIQDMHFGKASVCGTVTRSKWTETRAEPAAVYCADSHCIIVPKICGNVSRISREPVVAANIPGQPPASPRRDWDIPDSDLGLVDAPFALDLPPLSEPVLLGAPARPVLAAVPVVPVPREELLGRPRYNVPIPGDVGIGSPVHPIKPSNPVAPVPEPETYAMMLGGLALLGFMARRKRRQDAATAE
jgi:hypothetical protein